MLIRPNINEPKTLRQIAPPGSSPFPYLCLATRIVTTASAGSGAPARQRKLGAAHFAFMRGLVQGLALRPMWERYLQAEGSPSDLRVVRSTIAWMRDAFAAAARRENRFGTARLVLIDVDTLADGQPALPSLEAFAASRGLQEFCKRPANPS